MKEELQRFYNLFGHCYVSPSDDKTLFDWINKTRRSKSRLDSSMIDFLNSMNFDWRILSKHDQHWLYMYHVLLSFKKEFKHTKVPLRYKEDQRLGVWVSEQRKRKLKLADWKIKLLDDIQFVWDLNLDQEREAQWLKMYEQLIEFKAKHGHTRVPSKWEENPQLSKWVQHQRELEGKMSEVRRVKLNEINFYWQGDIQKLEDKRWEEKFEELKSFKKDYGHIVVPSTEPKFHQLFLWVERQRKVEKQMPTDRKKKLDSINFRWHRNIKAQQTQNWNKMYDELVAFYQKNGHCQVPNHSKEFPQLSAWVQRHRLRWDKLDKRKKEKLQALNFATTKDLAKEQREKWLLMLARLKKFKKEHGHCRVPSKYKLDPPLGRWVEVLRLEEKKLPDWKKMKLDELGFEWSSEIRSKKIKKWYEMHDRLLKFYKQYGHCRVPEYWQEDPELSVWVAYQRRPKKPLSIQKINLLKEINFDFEPGKKSRTRDEKGRFIPLTSEEAIKELVVLD